MGEMQTNKSRFYYMTPGRWFTLAGAVTSFSLLCSLLAGIYTFWSNAHLGPGAQQQAVWDVLVLPFLLATPILMILGLKLYENGAINAELVKLASTDVLTGLMNRRAFMEQIEKLLSDNTSGLAEGGFLIIDADRFKDINDSIGHQGGDNALCAIALAIKSSVRDGDIVARFGGEEFAVFVPGADAGLVAHIAERIVTGVNSIPFTTGGRTVRLAVSVGGASFSAPTEFDVLYRQADKHLYEAKSKGRNRAIVINLAA